MTTLQITVLLIWAGIATGFVYSVGAAFGGVKAGLELVFGAVSVIALYGAAGALLYYTGKAIFGY